MKLENEPQAIYRMYVLVLDDLPVGHAINTACHAAVSCTLKYRNTDEVQAWLSTSFRKITCKVTQKEFNKAIEVENDYVIMTELNLENRITAVAFKPRKEYHKAFKFFSLYK
jgi:peptidyl-tRNA hydrolase